MMCACGYHSDLRHIHCIIHADYYSGFLQLLVRRPISDSVEDEYVLP